VDNSLGRYLVFCIQYTEEKGWIASYLAMTEKNQGGALTKSRLHLDFLLCRKRARVLGFGNSRNTTV